MDGKNTDETETQGEKSKTTAPLKLVLKLHRNVTDDVKSKWTVAGDNTPKTTNAPDNAIPPLQEQELPQPASNVAVSGLKIKINRKQLVQADEETKKKKENVQEPLNTTKIKIPKEYYSTSKKSKSDHSTKIKSAEKVKIKNKKRKLDDFESESDSLDEDQMDLASSSDEKELREDAFDLPADDATPKSKTTRTDKTHKTSQDSNETSKTSSKKARQPTLQATLGKILKQLMKRDTLHFFYDPVTDDQAPDYSIIVKNPMDFSTMKKKLESGEYPTIEPFETDVKLICSNCMLYNAPETIYFKEAKKLLAFGNEVLKSCKEKISPELAAAATTVTEERTLRSSIQPMSPAPNAATPPSKMDTRQSKSADAKLKSIVREASKVQLPTLNQIVQPLLSIPTNNAPLYAAPLPAYATTTVPYALFVRRKNVPQYSAETRVEEQDNQFASAYYAYTPNYLNYRTKPVPVIKKSESARWDLESFLKQSGSQSEEKLQSFLTSVKQNRIPPVEVDTRVFQYLDTDDTELETASVDLEELLLDINAQPSREESLLDQSKDQPKILPPHLQELLDKNTYLLYQLQLHQYERGGGPPTEKEQRIAAQLLHTFFEVSNEMPPSVWIKSLPDAISNAMHFLDEMCY